ncbi:MAG: HDOD domain-containing protein [Betaproteobacteria bacterium]
MKPSLTDTEQLQLRVLLDNGIKIPPQPSILTEIERLLGQPQVHMGNVAALVAKDAGLAAMVFKIISSPVYGVRKPAESLEKAISVIGLKQLANIIKCAALRTALGDSAHDLKWFWDHSMDVAQLASIIAWKLRTVCNIFPDQAYMAGLFQECGVPILMQRFPDYSRTLHLSTSKAWPELAQENLHFKTDHCVTGSLLARYWHLPDFICQAVRFHHDIPSTEHKATTMVAILQMAVHIHNVYAQNTDFAWEKNRIPVLEELGISVEGLKEFEEEVYDSYRGS